MNRELQQIINDGIHTLNAGLDFRSTLMEMTQKAYQLGFIDGEESGFLKAQETVGEWNKPRSY